MRGTADAYPFPTLAAPLRFAIAQAARRESEAVNRMKDEFLATVSHELRTPLNAVLGWVHLLRTGKLDDKRFKKLLAEVQRDVPKPVEPGVLAAEIARLTGRERRRAQR